jgi:hypothetical protein
MLATAPNPEIDNDADATTGPVVILEPPPWPWPPTWPPLLPHELYGCDDGH